VTTTARPQPDETSTAPRQHTREFTRDDWRPAPDRFAGIEIDEFEWARQRARRATLFWFVTVLTLAGLIAVGAWTLGSNLQGLL
jgi:serine/threonine-protein kinase